MIFTKAPFRISLLGGGTDYPLWCDNHGGSVIGSTINKYSYVMARELPPFFDYDIRLVYSEIEQVKTVEQIRHPVIKAVIERIFPTSPRLEIMHCSDLPGKSGIGSSSSFLVALIDALSKVKGCGYNKMLLAREAINIEQNVLHENVGYQDSIFATYRHFNHIQFLGDGEFKVNYLPIRPSSLAELQSHVLLLFTKSRRRASDIAKTYVPKLLRKKKIQKGIQELTDKGLEAIYKQDWIELGRLVDQNWQMKRRLSDKVSNPKIDEIYQTAIDNGAIGGKIMGAGGGGFMVFIAPPDTHSNIVNALPSCLKIDFEFE